MPRHASREPIRSLAHNHSAGCVWHPDCHNTRRKPDGKVVRQVKLEISLFVGTLVTAAALLARVQAQGLEAALAAIAIENGVRAIRAGARVVRGALHWVA